MPTPGKPVFARQWIVPLLLLAGMLLSLTYQMCAGGLNKVSTENPYKVSRERARMLFVN